MSSKEYFRSRRKVKSKSTAYSITLRNQAEAALIALFDQNEEANVSQVIADALIFAHTNNMYINRYKMQDAPIITDGSQVAPPKTSKELSMERKVDWCKEFGGEVDLDKGTCTYTKYETTALGQIVRNTRSQAIKVMPVSYEDFRKTVIGGFASVGEAEFAFNKQNENEENK